MFRILGYSILFVLTIIGVWVFFMDGSIGGKDSGFKTRTKEVDIGFTGYAAQNKFFAAQRFLEAQGKKVRSQSRLFGIFRNLGENDFVMLFRHGRNIPREQADRLLAWVHDGGRLIIGEQYKKQKPRHDILFEKFGLIQTNTSPKSVQPILYFNSNKPVAVAFDNAVRLQYKGRLPTNIIRDSHGVLVYRLKYGSGYITVYSDISVFTNSRIGLKEHAALLTYTLRSRMPAKVWLIYGNDASSLLGLIITYLWAFLISLATIFILWVWKSSHRFGPVLDRIKLDRRSLLEHIRGAGSLQWKYEGRSRLFYAVRRSLHHRIETRHPDWLELSEDGLINELGQSSGVSLEKIKYVIRANAIKNEHDFVRLVQTTIQIRNSL